MHHCPGTTFADLLRWAQTVRLYVGSSRASMCRPDKQLCLLLDCQQVLDSPAAGNNGIAANRGSQVLEASDWVGASAEGGLALISLFEGALEAAERDKCWLAAVQLAFVYAAATCNMYASLQQLPGRGGLQRLLLARLRQLAQRARSLLERVSQLKIAPRVLRQEWEGGLQRLDRDVQLAAAGRAIQPAGPCSMAILKPEHCAGCDGPSLTLLRCSICRKTAYCSKDCQTKHWKAGHRTECKRLAAERAGA
ncbi:hypothetical protein ABPG75_010798 [Micractinium tetrahymenae]